MPFMDASFAPIDLPRNIALLDTNVLIGVAKNDAEMLASLDLLGSNYLISPVIFVETWNMLVGKAKDKAAAFNLADYAMRSPGVILLHGHRGSFEESDDHTRLLDIDFADAHLVTTAVQLRGIMNERITIVTNDTRDFLRLLPQFSTVFRLFVPDNLETLEM